jgi:hypothetical protein
MGLAPLSLGWSYTTTWLDVQGVGGGHTASCSIPSCRRGPFDQEVVVVKAVVRLRLGAFTLESMAP